METAVVGFSKHGECIGILSDLSALAGVDEFVAVVSEYQERISILFNNAGATWGEKMDAFPEKGWDKMMDVINPAAI